MEIICKLNYQDLNYPLKKKNDFINLSKLFSYIESNSQEKEIYEHKRQIFINSSDNIFYHGLIITIKDQKKFCELKSDDNENFKIQVKDIDELSKIMDFNFFIVNKKYWNRNISVLPSIIFFKFIWIFFKKHISKHERY